MNTARQAFLLGKLQEDAKAVQLAARKAHTLDLLNGSCINDKTKALVLGDTLNTLIATAYMLATDPHVPGISWGDEFNRLKTHLDSHYAVVQ